MSVRLHRFRAMVRLPLIAAIIGFVGPVFDISASPFGVAVHLPNEIQLDHADDLGIDWIRIDFIWALAEPEQDVFDWEIFDQLILEAEQRNMRIFATIAGTPAWATSGVEGPGVPDHPADWTDICYRAAARYRGRVEAWGMWNEPNLDKFWEGTRQDYLSQILRRGADAVHAADKQALVGGPELAHLNSANWEDWLKTCVLGAQDELDVVTHHVYPSGVSASDVTRKLEVGGSYPWDPPSVIYVLRDADWFGRPFWLTETGAESEPTGPYAQAIFYENLLTEWFPSGGSAKWIDRIFFYQLVDDPRYPEITWGIIGPPPELQRKLAFDYYKDFIAESLVDDARLLSWGPDAVLTPGQWNTVTIRAVNEGTTTWRAGHGFGISVAGLPANWQVMGGQVAQDSVVVPGSVTDVDLKLMPPAAGWGFPNLRYEITFRMTGRDGLGLGSPLRAGVVSGWRSFPEIVRQPMAEVVDLGDDAVFRVVVEGRADLGYSWFHNGVEVKDGNRFSGTKTAVLTVHQAAADDTGDYYCRIDSAAGWIMSDYAELLLPDDGRGGPREGDGRTAREFGPTPSFKSFFEEAARRHAVGR